MWILSLNTPMKVWVLKWGCITKALYFMVYILWQKDLPLRHFSKTCFLVCYATNPSLEGTFEHCLTSIRVITEAVGGRQDQAYDKNELEIPIVRSSILGWSVYLDLLRCWADIRLPAEWEWAAVFREAAKGLHFHENSQRVGKGVSYICTYKMYT